MAGDESSMDQAVVDARLNEIITRFGATLSDEQRAQVRTRIERTLQLASKLRVLPLGNADEPEIGFAPFRRDL